MALEATFLKAEQIWGGVHYKGQLQVMKDYGIETGLSDLAILLGGLIGDNTTSDNQRAGFVWSASPFAVGDVSCVHADRGECHFIPSDRRISARPALPSSETPKITFGEQPDEARLTRKVIGWDGKEIQVAEYGEYPQTIASENVNKELEQLLKAGKLLATAKKYTFDGEKNDYDSNKPFKAKEYTEYQHNGKRYIRVEAQPSDVDSVLSNGRRPRAGEACWIEVQPIEWLVDPSGVWVARQALFAGVQFNKEAYEGNFEKFNIYGRFDGYFEKTDIYRFTNEHFLKDIQVRRGLDTLGPHTSALADKTGEQRQR